MSATEDVHVIRGIVAMKLRARLTPEQLNGVACIRCHAYDNDGLMVHAGVLDGGALWRCKDDGTTPGSKCTKDAGSVIDPSRIELLLERCDREDANAAPDRRFLYTSEIRWLLGVGPGPDYSKLEKLVNGDGQ